VIQRKTVHEGVQRVMTCRYDFGGLFYISLLLDRLPTSSMGWPVRVEPARLL
jgi:hypothetical protein